MPVVAMPSISRRWKNMKRTKIGTTRQDRHREEAAEVRLAAGVHEGPQAELEGVGAHVVQVDQRREEIVPRPDEREDRGGRQHRHRQRQHDLPVDPPRPAAVHHRGLVEFARDAAEELHHQEDEERVRRQELRHDQRQDGVDPAEVQEQHVLGNQRDVVGQHERAQHQREPEVPALEVQPREGVGGQRARRRRCR